MISWIVFVFHVGLAVQAWESSSLPKTCLFCSDSATMLASIASIRGSPCPSESGTIRWGKYNEARDFQIDCSHIDVGLQFRSRLQPERCHAHYAGDYLSFRSNNRGAVPRNHAPPEVERDCQCQTPGTPRHTSHAEHRQSSARI